MGAEHDEQAGPSAESGQQSHLLRRVGKLKLFTNTTVLLFSIAGWEPDPMPWPNTSEGVNHSAAGGGVRLNIGHPVTFELQRSKQTNGAKSLLV